MEFGGREIMFVLGALVLLAIVLDVTRRMRRARYEKIRMPRRKQPIFDDDVEFDEYGSELPSGGARVVGQRDESDLEEMTRSLKDIAEASKPKLSIPVRTPEQSAFDLGDAADKQEPAQQEPVAEAATTAELAAEKPISAVLVLHLMAAEGEYFSGDSLLEAFLGCGLRYGSMKIFHRHEAEDGSGAVLFSVANSVNPGVFDLKTIAELNTPGVSLFFASDDVANPAQAFEEMLSTAETLAQRLGGQLRDENRKPLTSQAIDSCRQKVAAMPASTPSSDPSSNQGSA